MQITHKGRTLNEAQWEEVTGISRSAILSRIGRGWTVDDCLTTPNYVNARQGDGKITKSMAERFLNDLTIDQIPRGLKRYLEGTKSKNFGTTLRENSRPAFDRWFSNVFVKQQTNA